MGSLWLPSVTNDSLGLVTAIYDIGCALGAVAAFLFGEQIGRKKSIIIANIIGMLPFSIWTHC
jgi:MFS family permease